jgi:hypothetical protein
MSIDIEDQNQKTPGNGKVLVGLLLLVLGIGYLFQQLDFFFIPNWLFSWPSWLIIWGLYVGARHNFRNSGWFIMVLIGLVFLSDDIFPGHNMHHMIWPLALIAFGIWLITKRNQNLSNNNWGRKWDEKWARKRGYSQPFEPVITPVTPVEPISAENAGAQSSSTTIPPIGSGSTNQSTYRGDDFLDAVSIFGGVKKTILSKNFRGGEIVNVFGGAELDFTQADIQGRVVIDITQIFGGTKIIVPSNWQVVSDLAAVFASVDDKRINRGVLDNDKILVLKGVSIFAGVDVRSY